MKLTGKCSWFGGPNDTGVAPDEGLAFIFDVEDQPSLFLPQQPPGTTGLARRLNPETFYIACRWDYDAPHQSKTELLEHRALVYAPDTGRDFTVRPADWGPNENTDRVADISPGLMAALGITTDDIIEVTYPYGGEEDDNMVIHRVAISAGHGKNCPGAVGIDGLHEEEETPKVMAKVAEELRRRSITAVTFWDQDSDNVSDNLDAIVDWHNDQKRDLDVSCHFNVSDGQGHGVEVLYATQEELAAEVSAAIATNGLTDRGAKYRGSDSPEGSLAFLTQTDGPAILIETCFLDNRGDVDIYRSRFDAICDSIAMAIAVHAVGAAPRPPRPTRPEPRPAVSVAITVPANVELEITVNGEELLI